MNKTIAFTITALFLLNFVSAGIVWTDITDSTSVDFFIEEPAEPEEPEQPEDDDEDWFDEIEEQERERQEDLLTNQYGEWKCINNRLQRTNIINNQEVIEYGGVCGLSYEPTQRKQPSVNNLWILPFSLMILIIITLILIVSVALLKR